MSCRASYNNTNSKLDTSLSVFCSRFRTLPVLALAGFVLVACGQPLTPLAPTPRPTRTPLPIVTAPAYPTDIATPLAEATLTPPPVTIEAGWEALATGMEIRVAWMWVSGIEGPTEIIILRIDPAYFDFRVHAALDAPKGVAEWQAVTGASALINGAFFEPGDTILGTLIEGGQAQGEPFEDHGGMLTIRDDTVDMRSLLESPLLPDEQFDYAISGRPMLLYPGGRAVDFDLSPEASRRTVVAQDRRGRILFLVNDNGAVSLYKMRDWLATTPELNITAAFNLDGGGSTGLSINMPNKTMLIDSWWAVASVLAIYPKD